MQEYVQRAEDLLITSLKLSKKQKYNVTRKDGYRICVHKIRNGSSGYDPLTDKQLTLIGKLYRENKTYKEIMKIMQISKSKVARGIQKFFDYKWKPSKEQIKKYEKPIIRLRKQGYSYVQIRKKLHIPSTLIFMILKKNNMHGQYRKN